MRRSTLIAVALLVVASAGCAANTSMTRPDANAPATNDENATRRPAIAPPIPPREPVPPLQQR